MSLLSHILMCFPPFQFNDLLLVASQHFVGTYSVRSELSVDSMEVGHGNNMNVPGSFLVTSTQKAVQLLDE